MYARTIDRNGADTLYGVGGINALEDQDGRGRIFGGESNDLVRGQDAPKGRETKRPPR